MLEQIIYTRCSPSRNLENGQVVWKEGLGFYSMSEDFIKIPDRIKLDRLVRRQNCTKMRAAGYVSSYSMLELDGDNVVLCYEVPRENTEEKRYNGNFIRSGNYIKQCLAGAPEDYPYKWFGSSCWNAHKLPQQEYYHDLEPTREPPMLEQQDASCSDGYIDDAKIDTFLDDGRRGLFKQILWFILSEFNKPVSERRVLLIKDEPENVELWVAAVERSLSVGLALQISFDTNISGVTQNNANNELFYYVNENTRAICTFDSRVTGLIKTPYAMIAGVHPKDTACANLRKTAISNFEIADGKNMTVTFEPDSFIDRAYFAAAAVHDESVAEFCGDVLPCLNMPENGWRLPELYDAYMYLLGNRHEVRRDYRRMLECMRELTRNGIPEEPQLCRRLLTQGLASYRSHAARDSENSFELICIYGGMAAPAGMVDDVMRVLKDRFDKMLSELPSSGKELCKAWSAFMSHSSAELRHRLSDALFDEQRIIACEKSAASLDVVTAMALFNMLMAKMGDDITVMMNDLSMSRLVIMLLVNSLDDGKALPEMLGWLSESPELFCFFAENTANYIDLYEKSKKKQWWDALVRFNGGNLVQLCELLCTRSGTGIDTVEGLLLDHAQRMGRFDKYIREAFESAMEKLPVNENTGLDFYRGWAALIKDKSDVIALAESLNSSEVSENVQEKLYDMLNSKVFSMTDRLDGELYGTMAEWSTELGLPSLVCERESLMRELESAEKRSDAVRAAECFMENMFPEPEGYTESAMFREICAYASAYNDPGLYLRMLSLFDMTAPEEHKETAAAFAEKLISDNGRRMGELLFGLYFAFTLNDLKLPCYDRAQTENIRAQLSIAFQEAMKKCYKPAMTEQIKKVEDVTITDRKALLELINKAVPSHGLKRLFGKRG